jgi:hypothetical protein
MPSEQEPFMSSITNANRNSPIPLWQQVVFCSVGCASLALAAGYMLGKGSAAAKAPVISDPPEMRFLGTRIVPVPIPFDKPENYMPPARDDDVEPVSSTSAAARDLSELPQTKLE